MQIDDLTAGLSLNFLIHLNTEQLQFESKILEVYPRRHTLLAEGVFTDDKIISFRGKGLVVDLIVTFPEEKPQLFKNVTTNVVKRADGTLCYTVFSVAGSKTYNRRQSYRCYVGIETAVQCGLNRAAHDAIIKDISYNGFSVVSKEDLKLEVNQTVHAVLNDHMDETAENFNFHLYGLVARIQELENGLFLYGCRLNNPVPGLEQYIIKKRTGCLTEKAVILRFYATISYNAKTAAPYGATVFVFKGLSLNSDVFIGLYRRFCFLLRNIQSQDTMFELALDILLSQVVTNIEATLASSGITLLADVFTGLLLLLILIQTFGSLNGQITILQRNLDLIFLEAGQINDQLIVVIGLLDIGLHYIMCMSAIQFLLYLILCSVVKERYIIKKVIK